MADTKSLFEILESEQVEIPHWREAPASAKSDWPSKVKRAAPVLIVIALLGILLVFRRPTAIQDSPAPDDTIEALFPVTVIPKDAPVLPEFFRMIPMSKKTLSKAQLWQSVIGDDLAKLRGKVYAKKTLSPREVLLWSALRIQVTSGAQAPGTQIFFSKEPQ